MEKKNLAVPLPSHMSCPKVKVQHNPSNSGKIILLTLIKVS